MADSGGPLVWTRLLRFGRFLAPLRLPRRRSCSRFFPAAAMSHMHHDVRFVSFLRTLSSGDGRQLMSDETYDKKKRLQSLQRG